MIKSIALAALLSSFALACSSSSGGSGQGQSAVTGDAGDGGSAALCCVFTIGTEHSMPYPESQCDTTSDPNTGAPLDGKWACAASGGPDPYTCRCVLNQECLTAADVDAGSVIVGQVKPCQ